MDQEVGEHWTPRDAVSSWKPYPSLAFAPACLSARSMTQHLAHIKGWRYYNLFMNSYEREAYS